MPQGSKVREPRLLSPGCRAWELRLLSPGAAATEAGAPWSLPPQQEKPLQCGAQALRLASAATQIPARAAAGETQGLPQSLAGEGPACHSWRRGQTATKTQHRRI